MEDSIDLILQDHSSIFPTNRPHPIVSACTGALLTGLYGVWSIFTMPGFRKIPWKLKVPYLPSCKDQTRNVMTLLEGRRGRLADLGSGDGRLVFAASSAGFQCTGFEINPILVAFSRSKAFWRGVPASQVVFLKKRLLEDRFVFFQQCDGFSRSRSDGVAGGEVVDGASRRGACHHMSFPFS
ncbi:hypothetical protein OJAV_G00088340 [Oryzias javanicus]|uniref:Methyltransferase domain-containing protein n=1 Tax=Oryzias javanicus TaxID=123683 RepID=A0A437CZB8_ORYJA|nr:hypothetical protein OJAV_G00088340 [Oryzias javanicus]